jgi:hypothetical protein
MFGRAAGAAGRAAATKPKRQGRRSFMGKRGRRVQLTTAEMPGWRKGVF